LEIRLIKSEDAEKWDELVNGSQMGNVFSSYSWLRITAEVCGVQLLLLGLYDGGELVGGCPVFVRKVYGFIKIVSSVCGMMPYSGVIIRDYQGRSVRGGEHYLHEALETFSSYLSSMKADFTHIDNSPELGDVRPFVLSGWDVAVRYTYLLEPRDVLLSSGVRESIKKARRSQVRVERAGDLEQFYSLYKATYLRQGIKPPVSREYLARLFNHLVNMYSGELWCAYTKEGRCVAAQITVWDERRLYNWAVSIEEESKKSGVGHLLYFETITHYMRETGKPINLMMGNIPRLSEFITGFNPRLVTYYSLQRKSLVFRVMEVVWRLTRKMLKIEIPY
jgi:hypothetical protein